MQKEFNNWEQWRQFFATRKDRRLPELDDPRSYSDIPDSIAKSLAIFQLGESGGGTVIEQARASKISAIDADYADAMQLFVAEENRHAEILAICVRNLGGKLIRSNWTARLFVFARRLIGLRLKVLVLLAAEVVGICYYHLLATRLPQCRLKSLLAQLVNDEKAHLHFHCSFLRTQVTNAAGRLLFKVSWRVTMLGAAIVVMLDHRHAIRDAGIGTAVVWRRWMTYSKIAERLIIASENQALTELSALIEKPRQPAQRTPAYSVAEMGLGH